MTLTGTKINGLKTFSLDGENDNNFSEKCRHPQFQVFNTYAKSNYLFIVMMYQCGPSSCGPEAFFFFPHLTDPNCVSYAPELDTNAKELKLKGPKRLGRRQKKMMPIITRFGLQKMKKWFGNGPYWLLLLQICVHLLH